MLKNIKGIALISVLMMIVIMVFLTTALIYLSRDLIFITSKYHKNTVALDIAEMGTREVLFKLENDPDWGKSLTENLYWKSSGQYSRTGSYDFTSYSGNSSLNDLTREGLFFVTFDSSCGFPYSVNNIGETTPKTGWKGRTVQPGFADIIIIGASGDTVKHIEIVCYKGLATDMPESGSMDKTEIYFDDLFKIDSSTGEPINIHSNANNVGDISMAIYTPDDPPGFDIEGSLSAAQNLKLQAGSTTTINPGAPHTYLKNSEGVKSLPKDFVISSQLTGGEGTLPAGQYIWNGSTWEKKDWSGNPITSPMPSGIDFLSGGEVKINSKIKCSYEPNTPSKGSLLITCEKFTLEKDCYIYMPGDPNTRPAGDNVYPEGNITLNVNDVAEGKGDIYAEGGVNISAGKFKTGTGKIAVYANGDININSNLEIETLGIIYTKGDLKLSTSPANKKELKFEGALFAVGNPPNTDTSVDKGSMVIESGSKIEIKFDPATTAILGGSSSTNSTGDINVVTWLEF